LYSQKSNNQKKKSQSQARAESSWQTRAKYTRVRTVDKSNLRRRRSSSMIGTRHKGRKKTTKGKKKNETEQENDVLEMRRIATGIATAIAYAIAVTSRAAKHFQTSIARLVQQPQIPCNLRTHNQHSALQDPDSDRCKRSGPASSN
jgi:hypothetical protein